jgi:hypothetical protein
VTAVAEALDRFKDSVRALGGYETSETGERIL